MPTVPTYDSPQVAAAPLPGAQVQGVSPRVLMQAEEPAMQMQRVGRDIQQGAQDLSAFQDRETMMANQVRVDDASNQIRSTMQSLTYDPQAGFLNQKGQAALQPNDQGQSLTQQYGQQLQDKIDEVSASLSNPAQQRVFNMQAAQLRTQFEGQLQSHVMQENKSYGLQTQQGTIALAQNAATNQWNDPEAVEQQVQSAQAAAWKAGQINGLPGNLVEAQIQSTTSSIRSEVVRAALTNGNPTYAMAYLDRYKGDFTADDALKMQGMVRGEVQARTATSAAQNAMQLHADAFQPTGMTRVQQITAATESGNRQDAVGPNVPGQGTAKGSMQVMDATNAAPGFGVTPAQDNSLTERTRVGNDYIAAMVQKYNGNTAQAWAAYNAGPGNVDKAIAAAGPNGDWMSKLADYQSPANHAQTVAYVQKNQQALQQGQGNPPLPSLQDIHNAIRAQPGVNDDPRVLNAALAEGTRLYNDQMNDRKVSGSNAMAQAQQYLIQNKGDFNSLPPDLKEGVMTYAPEKWNQLQDFASKVATPPTTTNMEAYHQAMQHPDELAAMPDAQFQDFIMRNFSPADQKTMVKLQQDYQNGKVDTSAETLNSPAIKNTLNNRLLSIDINPNPPTPDTEGRARIGSIQKFVNDDILQTQQQLGRKMTQAEVMTHIDQLFARNATLPGLLWGTNTKPLLSMKVGDIPSADRERAKAALSASGNDSPSNDQIIRWYWKRNQLDGK